QIDWLMWVHCPEVKHLQRSSSLPVAETTHAPAPGGETRESGRVVEARSAMEARLGRAGRKNGAIYRCDGGDRPSQTRLRVLKAPDRSEQLARAAGPANCRPM